MSIFFIHAFNLITLNLIQIKTHIARCLFNKIYCKSDLSKILSPSLVSFRLPLSGADRIILLHHPGRNHRHFSSAKKSIFNRFPFAVIQVKNVLFGNCFHPAACRVPFHNMFVPRIKGHVIRFYGGGIIVLFNLFIG